MPTGTATRTFDYRLPSLGADMDEGRVVEWRVAPGDVVRRGDVMAVVETEKSDIDIEIWHGGIVEAFLVEVGELIPVGTPIARLAAPEDTADEPAAPRPDDTADTVGLPAAPRPDDTADVPAALPSDDADIEPAVTPADALPPLPWEEPPPTAAEPPSDPGTGHVRASPYARRLARSRGIDLGGLHGSGPDGAVVAADVTERAAAMRRTTGAAAETTTETATGVTGSSAASPHAAPSAAAPRQRSPESMRRLIAERMSKANREIPHYRLVRDVDVSALQHWLSETNAERPIAERILPAAAYVRAVALAAARHPELNGFWRDDAFQSGDGVHVAMAISLRRGGLVTPHVADADRASIDQIMDRLQELVAAARSGTLKSSWMTGSTITLTNLGDTGADLVHGVISPPQVALVGMGRVTDRPWVADGELVVRPVLTVTLAADHRATDGAIGSRFLSTLAHALEHPEEL